MEDHVSDESEPDGASTTSLKSSHQLRMYSSWQRNRLRCISLMASNPRDLQERHFDSGGQCLQACLRHNSRHAHAAASHQWRQPVTCTTENLALKHHQWPRAHDQTAREAPLMQQPQWLWARRRKQRSLH
jgi:hypothetical protein